MAAVGEVSAGASGFRPPDESDAEAGACILGHDELRLVFAALLTTRNCEKDVGRCLCVCKEWSEVLVHTPSLWFKLFSLLDPTEAARAAAVAPAPAPGTVAKRGSGAEKDFRDNDFQRRFIEQYCWRKTTLCSRCFEPSTNAPINAWKVRLCSPCIAASIFNKTDSSKTFMLTPTDLAPLPTWVNGVQTPFGGMVKFYFRRHLERTAAQKHGADGVEAARQKQTERKQKRVQSHVDDKESKVAQVEEVLKDCGVEGGFSALHRLGHYLAAAVQLFVDPKTTGKKRRGGAADAPLELTTIEQVSAAIRKDCTRKKRRTALSEACALAGFCVDNNAHTLQPGVYAAYEAFVSEEDSAFDAVLKKAAKSEPAAKKLKTGKSAAKKGKRRAHRSSDDEDTDADAAEADDDMELSEEEEAAIKPKPSRRRRGAAVTKDSGASAAEDLSAAALATVRDLMLRERRDGEVLAELRLRLNLGALDLKCPQVASALFFRSTPQFKALLEKLNALSPAAASKRSSTAASTATELGAAAAQDILSGISERKAIISAVTKSKLQELAASGRSDAVIARLLECSAPEAAAVFDYLRVHHVEVINELMLHGSVTLPAPAAGPASEPLTMEQLDDIMATLVHHLHLKLRKGEMKERVTALFEALRPASAPPAEREESALAVALRSMHESFSSTSSPHLYSRRAAAGIIITDPASLGAQLRDLLAESKLQNSTFAFAVSPLGSWTDLTLVQASGDGAVLVAQAAATPLGRCLEQISTVLSKAEPARQFVRWVLDGRVDVAGGEPKAVDAAHIAACLSGAADARTGLLAAVRALQGPNPSEPFTLNSAPSELLERIELFLTANQFISASGGLLTGEAAMTALMAWASSSLIAQERRFIKLKQAFDEAELDASALRSYTLSDPLDGVHNITMATARDLKAGLLFFLRGPKDVYSRRQLTGWRNEAVQKLVQKARIMKNEEETRGARGAAQARSSKMATLRSMLEHRVEAKMRSDDADWSFRDSYWAQKHAKEQSVVFRKFLDDTVNAAFPPAAASAAAAAAEVVEAEDVDLKAIADAAEATPAFDTAVNDMVKLQKAAKGLSHSVFMATHLQQQLGGGGGGYYGSGGFMAWDGTDVDGDFD